VWSHPQPDEGAWRLRAITGQLIHRNVSAALRAILSLLLMEAFLMSRLQKLATAFTALLLAGGAVYYWGMVREISVHTAAPQANTEVRVFGIGTVEAQTVSKVAFQIAGKIASINADQGDFIKAGVLLAKLDDDSQRAKLMKSAAAERQAAANLTKAQAQQNRAEITSRQKKSVNARRQQLAARGVVTPETAEDAQAAEEIADSDVRVFSADASVATALQDDAAAQRRVEEVLFNQHELRAPFDARVIARYKELGSIVNAGEAVFTLIAPESVWVRAYVDEALAGGLSVGQTAFVRLRSEADRVVEAEVVRIDQENDRVTEERRIYVRCRICESKHQLRFLGEQAEVEIVKRLVDSGLFVPLRFVESYDGRSGSIWVLKDGRLAKQRVQFGERLLDGRIEITTKLQPGIEVVTDERSDLREGRAARPNSRGGS
jgi:HlyD family secretion protein